MRKKPRLGSDPLGWIRDTRKDLEGMPAAEGKQSKHSLHNKQIKQRIPRTEPKPLNPVKRGLKPGWTRATFIIRDEHLDKVKALAYWDRKEIKEVIDEALRSYLKGKSIKPIKKEGV